MSVEQRNLESSSGDSVAKQIPEEKGSEPGSPQDKFDRDAPLESNELEHRLEENNAVEKEESGSPLDRAPSQAAKMGKKKIAVVMTALCVCICADTPGTFARGVMLPER